MPVALVEPFHAELALAVTVAIDGAGDRLDQRMEAAVDAYFDVVAAYGYVIAQLGPTPSIRQAAAERQDAERFVEALFVDRFGVPRAAARATGDVVLATLNGAVTSWARKRPRLARSGTSQPRRAWQRSPQPLRQHVQPKDKDT